MKTKISHIGFLLLAIQLLVVFLPCNSIAQEKESYIKAILIYKFIPFIKWGGDCPSNSDKKYICTIGKSDVGKLLDIIAKNNYENYIISKEIELGDMPNCDVVFVADVSKFTSNKNTQKDIIKQIIEIAKTNNILTLSDMEDFIKNGGMIGFVEDKEMIKFEINVIAANEALLSIEAILLELAVKIYR